MKILVIPESTAVEAFMGEVSDDPATQLKNLQHLVGGYVEQVRTHRMEMKQNVALVDEEGRVKGKKANFRAQAFTAYPAILSGTVLICGYSRDPIEGDTWSDYNE